MCPRRGDVCCTGRPGRWVPVSVDVAAGSGAAAPAAWVPGGGDARTIGILRGAVLTPWPSARAADALRADGPGGAATGTNWVEGKVVISSRDKPETTTDVAAVGALGGASRSVLDTAHEAYVRMDAGGFITDLNPAAEAVFGWSRAEAIGRVLGDTIIPEHLRDQHLAGLERFLATGVGPVLGKRLQLSAIHRDGHEFPVEITISTTREGDTPSFHAFLHDVSQRVRAEQYRATQHAVTGALAEADTVQAAVPQILRALGEGMGWDVGVYWTPGATGELCFGEIWQTAGLHLRAFEDACRRLTFVVGAGLPGRVWRDGRPLFVADVATDHGLPRRQVAAEAGLHASVGLALVGRDGVRGVIELFTRELQRHDDELLAMMSTLSTQIARFIVILTERQDALERLEALALTDSLTGLANRRAWDEGLARELARAKRHGDPLCVALLDLDAFKAFNDRYGHQAGDDALTAAADGWQARVRATDLLARYGGEEFALALPAQDLPAALVAVERLRTAMPAGVTCSAGLARWTAGESTAKLVGRADGALYAAKDAGRDRTVTAA